MNIIGAGRVGKTLSRMFTQGGAANINAVCNKTLASAERAIEYIGAGQAVANIAYLPSADITFITTTDDCIATCAEKLATNKNLKKGSLIVHCSGALSSDVLQLTKNKNCLIASMHPMRSFSDVKLTVKNFTNTYCALEGDIAAISILTTLMKSLGAKTFTLNAAQKNSYHIGGVYASNYLVGIIDQAQQHLVTAGIDKDTALDISLQLAQGTLDNIKSAGDCKNALTGPIKRGDLATINTHLESLKHSSSVMLYKQLGLSVLQLATLPDDTQKRLVALLRQKTI